MSEAFNVENANKSKCFACSVASAPRGCVHALVQSRCGVQPPRGRCIWLWVDELIKAIRITETEHSAMITRDWEPGEGEMLLEFPEIYFTTQWEPYPSKLHT